MRASALISIRPVLDQAIKAINDSFEREKQSQKVSAEFGKEYERLLASSEGSEPTTGSEQSSKTQDQRVRLSRPSIEGLYPWRHRVVLAASALAECGWTIEAGAIHDELNNLPKQQVNWAQPGLRDEMKADIQKVGTRIRDVLACCITEIQAPKSDASSVLPSSNHESTTETVDNPNTILARKQLRPYVEITEFREYLKEQILKWETWHRAHIEEINDFEGLRDNLHRELTDLQGDEIRHSDDPAGFDALGHAETCYENYRDIAAGLKDDPEYKLVADREPVLFKEASVASIVALFWCDVNDSTLLVPEYEFLEPEGPFVEYLREQWEKPIQERYKHIDWYVEAAIKTYESRNASGGDEEMEPDSITIDSASSAVPEANQALQVNPPVSVVTPPHVPPISTDDSLDVFPERLAPKLPQAADTGLTKAQSKEAKDQTWQKVKAELERMRLQGEPYTSEKKLAEKIGCSKFLVNKAFKNGSAELLEWRTKSHVESRLNVSPEASALAIERTAQSREDDPADFIDPEEVDEVMEYLIDQAGESQRPHLAQMTPDQRQAMAKIMLNDPDKEDQFSRHQKAKRSRRD